MIHHRGPGACPPYLVGFLLHKMLDELMLVRQVHADHLQHVLRHWPISDPVNAGDVPLHQVLVQLMATVIIINVLSRLK